MTAEALHTHAAAGRGLWAGLFVVPCACSDVCTCWHKILPPGAHITLAHFGRKVSREKVERAILAWRGAAAQAPTTCVATPWASARMDQSKGSVEALLVEGDTVMELHAALASRAQALGVGADRTFQFHPHVTLRHLEHAEDVVLPRRSKMKLVFSALTLVCGEARLHFDLGAATESPLQQMGLPF